MDNIPCRGYKYLLLELLFNVAVIGIMNIGAIAAVLKLVKINVN